MWQRLFRLFEAESATLQSRIQDMLVHAILEGFISPGDPVPSSRKLAEMLGVSRSTVTLALQRLSDLGFLKPRDRSGHYVHPNITDTFLGANRQTPAAEDDRGVTWGRRLQIDLSLQRNIVKPSNWQSLRYPFVYGQFDHTLFPKNNWRHCVSESMQVAAIRAWAPDHIDQDDPHLIEQIQQRLLPARGIWSRREEILVTSGAQNAAFMLAALLMGRETVVGIENPGYPDARNIFSMHSRFVRPLGVDADGLMIDESLRGCDYVYVTPSHQCPTAVTMPLERRQALLRRARDEDFVVIEDDHESELNFRGRPTPALKSLDSDDRVIYIGSLSKTLSHGLRLGYVVGPRVLISELRRLRRLMLRHPASNNQRAAALFVGHGYHEAYVHRLNETYRKRATALRRAMDRYLPAFTYSTSHGGSALWVETPAGIDTRQLASDAIRHDVVIEPGDVFFADDDPPANCLRMGYSSIPEERIEDGVIQLARLIAHVRPTTPAEHGSQT